MLVIPAAFCAPRTTPFPLDCWPSLFFPPLSPQLLITPPLPLLCRLLSAFMPLPWPFADPPPDDWLALVNDVIAFCFIGNRKKFQETRRREAHDEDGSDDEDEGGGPGGAQCRAQ